MYSSSSTLQVLTLGKKCNFYFLFSNPTSATTIIFGRSYNCPLPDQVFPNVTELHIGRNFKHNLFLSKNFPNLKYLKFKSTSPDKFGEVGSNSTYKYKVPKDCIVEFLNIQLINNFSKLAEVLLFEYHSIFLFV